MDRRGVYEPVMHAASGKNDCIEMAVFRMIPFPGGAGKVRRR